MTGYTVHTGATDKFTQGWDTIFAKSDSKNKSAKTKSTGQKKKAGKKAPTAKAKTSSARRKKK